jgi:hypothetical protein
MTTKEKAATWNRAKRLTVIVFTVPPWAIQRMVGSGENSTASNATPIPPLLRTSGASDVCY